MIFIHKYHHNSEEFCNWCKIYNNLTLFRSLIAQNLVRFVYICTGISVDEDVTSHCCYGSSGDAVVDTVVGQQVVHTRQLGTAPTYHHSHIVLNRRSSTLMFLFMRRVTHKPSTSIR